MIIRYLDAAGEEILTEHRRACGAVWFLADSPLRHAAVIEFRFEFDTPEVTVSRLGVAGLGTYDVQVDGRTVASGTLSTKPGDDPATAVLNPPFEHFEFSTGAATADVVVSFRPVAGEVPHAMCLRVGTPPPADEPEVLIAEAVRAARAAEVAVVVVGTSASVESEGFDRTSLGLPGHQDALVRAVAAANPRTVVVVNSGAPVLLPWRDEVAAVVATWFPGQEFGTALAHVLSGDLEPGGRLPVSWPADEGDVPVGNVTPEGGRLEYTEGYPHRLPGLAAGQPQARLRVRLRVGLHHLGAHEPRGGCDPRNWWLSGNSRVDPQHRRAGRQGRRPVVPGARGSVRRAASRAVVGRLRGCPARPW